MSAPAFTPGPWFLHPDAHGAIEIWSGSPLHPDKFIADADIDNTIHHAKRLANGQLLAASPDLLAAACAALAWEAETRGRLGLPQVDAPEWVQVAIAAIAKAEGKET